MNSSVNVRHHIVQRAADSYQVRNLGSSGNRVYHAHQRPSTALYQLPSGTRMMGFIFS